MNLPKRAPVCAEEGTRAPWRTAVLTSAAAMMLLSLALPRHADAFMTRSQRVHPRSVAQEQEPAPGRTHGGAHHSSKATTQSKKKAGSKGTETAHSKPRRKSHVQVDEPEPVVMKRAHGKSKLAPVQQETAATRKPQEGRHAATTHATELAAQQQESARSSTHPAKTETAASKPQHAQGVQEAASNPEPRKPLRTNDFVAAVQGSASNNAYAEGVSHPDEMDETKPLENVSAAPAAHKTTVAVAQVSANTTAPAQPSAPARVNGFGAEGAPASTGHRTLAKTMATHRAEIEAMDAAPPAPATKPISAVEQEEITDEVVRPQVLPAVYTRGGRIVMPAPLKGSHEVLVHQNEMADQDGLERLNNDSDLNRLIASHDLKRLPETEYLHVNEELPENRRYARPWTVRFASEIGKSFESRFGVALQVNSAVRTVSYQLRLMRTNGNAAAVRGDTASPHLTGQAIDIGKRGMSNAQIAWMRAYLQPLMQEGKIDVEEEFQQACFHISVYRAYQEAPRKRSRTPENVAEVRHNDSADN
ncbi:MAG: DUF5715 family protein [Acidobacteriaceae bacterium]|nr:DUF5715 family protein [Acidobacteriaceae bacterium]